MKLGSSLTEESVIALATLATPLKFTRKNNRPRVATPDSLPSSGD